MDRERSGYSRPDRRGVHRVLCVTCAAMFAILWPTCSCATSSVRAWNGRPSSGTALPLVRHGGRRAGNPAQRAHLHRTSSSTGRPGPRAVADPRAVLIIGTYAVLAWVALDLLPIVADERTPVLGVPGSVTYFVLLLGFVLIGLVDPRAGPARDPDPC